MAREVAEPFHMKDLFIDVKLEACVNGSKFDFLGRQLFSSEFFRKDIGFGIINIDIEVNTSLQPLISITFKDLYGQTVFGGQKRQDYSATKTVSSDYSVLFDWPPPKFLFSFKGYLGAPVSWMLNLKRTSTSFNSSDGSYEVKCEFVPNQWGFFADLPVLFLLACKSLRRDGLGNLKSLSPQERKKKLDTVTSIFDLVKIGKQVEIKTQDTTKEFDGLVKQLGSIKSNIAGTLSSSKVISFGDSISGVVNNISVKGFIPITIPNISELDSAVNSPEKISNRLGDPLRLTQLNTYLLLKLKFNGKQALEGVEYLNINDGDTYQIAKNQALRSIDTNLKLVDDEIKRRVFSTSEKKLEKITIGQIFGQLAKDAGYIIGSILDSGLEGLRNNRSSREVNEELLIGSSFPLAINDDGEEVPATSGENVGIKKNKKSKNNFPTDVGVDKYEMFFVRKFINAISEGIARDLLDDDDSISEDNSLVNRVNNLEMVKENPYKPFYQNIATNILVRGGIAGYITRSNDPNRPGDYGNKSSLDNDSSGNIIELADREVKNISDAILNNLSDIDNLLLKRFCKFFKRFYDSEGINVLKNDGTVNNQFLLDLNEEQIKIYANYPVLMSENPNEFLSFAQLFGELRKGVIVENGIQSFQDVDKSDEKDETSGEVIQNSEEFEEVVNVEHPLSFVDTKTYSSKKIINNGIAYTTPSDNAVDNRYWYVVFEDADNLKAQEVNSSPSDVEYRDEDKDDTNNMYFTLEKPLGYVPVNSVFATKSTVDAVVDTVIDGVLDAVLGVLSPLVTIVAAVTTRVVPEGKVVAGRVVTLEGRRDNFEVLDYNKIKNPKSSFYDKDTSSGFSNYLWKKQIYESKEDAIKQGVTDFSQVAIAGNFGYTVFSNFDKNTFGDDASVFSMFLSENRSTNQRVFIRRVCELILNNLNRLDEERNQIMGSVLGKAADQEALIYKQMHTLFHQWQSLAYGTIGDCGSEVSEKTNLASELEEKYGGSHNSIYKDEDVNGLPDGTFIYDFPLQRITGAETGQVVNVKNSLINIEPLYRPNGETSVLNIIQKICTKNNFLFVPIPGYSSYLKVSDIYKPSPLKADFNHNITNYFHVLFTPTPESRSKIKNGGKELTLTKGHKQYDANSFSIKYGHPDNQIVSNIQVSTEENKVTAESIVNLQRLVDNENQNKTVTTDCSTLQVLQGRSYTVSVDMLGNAQIFPMQFFFLENAPLFGGLYQVMKVKHSITPNDMKTSVEGMRMRFNPQGYASIKPITLETLRELGEVEAPQSFTKDEVKSIGVVQDIVNYIGNVEVFKGGPEPDISQKDVIDKIIKYANDIGIKDKNRLFCLLVVAKKESNFEIISESGHYSLKGARATWKKVEKLSVEDGKKLILPSKGGSGQVDSLFNFVYGGKYGNNNLKDGYKYRGRGLSQITYKGNYESMQKKIKRFYPETIGDISQNPELLLQLEYAVKSHVIGKVTQQFGSFSAKIDFLNSAENVHRSNHGTSKTKAINKETFEHTKKSFYFCKTDKYIQNALKKFPDYS